MTRRPAGAVSPRRDRAPARTAGADARGWRGRWGCSWRLPSGLAPRLAAAGGAAWHQPARAAQTALKSALKGMSKARPAALLTIPGRFGMLHGACRQPPERDTHLDGQSRNPPAEWFRGLSDRWPSRRVSHPQDRSPARRHCPGRRRAAQPRATHRAALGRPQRGAGTAQPEPEPHLDPDRAG